MTPSVELPKRRALGKGLESLLPGRSGFTPAPAVANAAPVPDEGKPREIPVDHIERNPFQTRGTVDESALKELSASIAARLAARSCDAIMASSRSVRRGFSGLNSVV